MYLVPLHNPNRMQPDPTSWLVTALVDELETLAIECREAAVDHRGGAATERSLESVRSLDQAADTCVEIIQLIRREYQRGLTGPGKHLRTTQSRLTMLPDVHVGHQQPD